MIIYSKSEEEFIREQGEYLQKGLEVLTEKLHKSTPSSLEGESVSLRRNGDNALLSYAGYEFSVQVKKTRKVTLALIGIPLVWFEMDDYQLNVSGAIRNLVGQVLDGIKESYEVPSSVLACSGVCIFVKGVPMDDGGLLHLQMSWSAHHPALKKELEKVLSPSVEETVSLMVRNKTLGGNQKMVSATIEKYRRAVAAATSKAIESLDSALGVIRVTYHSGDVVNYPFYSDFEMPADGKGLITITDPPPGVPQFILLNGGVRSYTVVWKEEKWEDIFQ